MKKTICITSFDQTILLRLEALRVLNEFKKLGFYKYEAFKNIVLSTSKTLNTEDDLPAIKAFFYGRKADDEINGDLSNVIEKLKAE